MADKAGVALRFDRGEGRADDRIAVEIELEGRFKPPAGAGVGINEAASGACPVPTRVEVPYMHLAAGVIAPKDLVLGANRFSSQHLPGGAGITRARGRAKDGDRRECGANADVGLAAIDKAADKAGVALRFDRDEGRTEEQIAVEIKLEGRFKPPASAGVGINEAASGACPVPTGIEVPYMHFAAGIIAPKDLVLGANRFSGQHLPGGAGATCAGGRTEERDRLHRGANLYVSLTIATAHQGRIALTFNCRDEGRTDKQIAVEIKLEGRFKPPASAGVGIDEAASGACPVPTGIKVPYMHFAAGIIAPKDLVSRADRFSGQHLPGGAGVARAGGRTEERDRLRRGANLCVSLTIATAHQDRIALIFNCDVVIEDRSNNCSRGANAVAAAGREDEGNGFIWLDLSISRWIHRDDGGGGSSGKAHRLGGRCGRNAAVIGAKAGVAGDIVVQRQSGGGGACS